MLATGVSTQSLLRNETPLKDITGRELSPKSEADVISELSYKHEINMFDMLTAVVKAAKEKKRVTVFYNLFSEWLPQAAASIGVIPTVEKVLTNDLGLFDTVHVPEAFQPTDPKIKKRWDESQRELLMAIVERAGGIEKVTRDPSAYVKAYLDEFKSRRAKQPMRLSSSS